SCAVFSILLTQTKICGSGTSSQRSSSSSSASVRDVRCASANPPSTRSISRMPRCQQRKSRRRRRGSRPSLERFVPVVTACLQRQKPGRGRVGLYRGLALRCQPPLCTGLHCAEIPHKPACPYAAAGAQSFVCFTQEPDG